MGSVRVAIVGTGNSVNNHLTAIQSVQDRVHLVAAVDIEEERVRTYCTENGIPNWYTSVTEMLAAEQPDLVCIVTPSSTHKELSIECLNAGANVFCEKPLCASLAEFDEIREAERNSGRFVSTVFQWRFGAGGKHLKKLIAKEAFGKPLVAVCNTLWYRDDAYYSAPWRSTFQNAFGGATTTLGIHLMDFLLWLMGDWTEVWAIKDTLNHDMEVEDISMAMVRFSNGAVGSMINSALSPRQESYLRLDFEKTTVELSALYRYGNEHWTISPVENEAQVIMEAWDAMEDDFSSSHDQELSEVLNSMEGDHPVPVNGDEARRIVNFIASLYKSAATSKPVRNGEITADDPFYYSNNPTT